MLRVSDIDSKRLLIRVEQGKGRKVPCSLHSCSIFCARGGDSVGRKAGCSPVAPRCYRSRLGS
jgi:hypothetical protein